MTIDTLTLFQKVCIAKKSDDDPRKLFKYELVPFPMSIFTEDGMRKSIKSVPIYEEIDLASSKHAVLDGGYLLRKVVWSNNSAATFRSMCKTYVDYMKNRFRCNITVVFDRYPDDVHY